MNKQLTFKNLLARAFFILMFCGGVQAGAENEKKADDRERVEERRGQAKRASMADWSPEDRKEMKTALRVVWEKAEVLQARDEVKRATEAFRSAVQEAMLEEDPRLAGLMKKLHDAARGKTGGRRESGLRTDPHSGSGDNLRKGGRAPMKKKRSAAGNVAAIGPVGFRTLPKDFSLEDKRRLNAAQEKAMQSVDYKTSQEKLQGLFKRGVQLRKQRVAMFQQIREQLRKQMIEVDPEVQVLLERLKKKRVKGDRAPVKGD